MEITQEEKANSILIELDDNTKQVIKEKLEEIEDLKSKIDSLENGEDYESYDNMLDECSDIIKIGSLEYYPSNVLKSIDEIAYNIGYYEYIDNEITDLKSQIDDLKEEIEDLKKECLE